MRKCTICRYFRKQLELNSSLNLPLFLHCRNATDDFLDIIKDHPDQIGVIHSFTDSESDLRKMLQTNFFIGVNGWLVFEILSMLRMHSSFCLNDNYQLTFFVSS